MGRFIFDSFLDFINSRYENPVPAEFPRVNGLFQRVKTLPRVAEWIKNRPITNF